METLEPGRCPSVRLVFCSGEALPFAFQERFFAKSAAELHNLYGPTEASVDVTHWACERAPSVPVVPIGRPVANTQAYVLDRRLEPCALGVPGRLYLGGVQLARGYLRRPALTAERFVPDPLGFRPGARLYDTGDVARWRPDGSLEYLGRADQQVKLRGVRVEPAEVEAALLRETVVREAAVALRSSAAGEPMLVAYVVAQAGATLDPRSLRTALRARLPEALLPGAFVVLPRLPRTPSGKLDRQSLPAPEAAQLEREHVAPRTELERALCEIWAEVFGRERVSVHDDFFELGGHSLLATQFVSRVREAYHVELPLRMIYERASVADFAGAVVRARAEQADEAELARLVAELEGLSEAETSGLLAQRDDVSAPGE